MLPLVVALQMAMFPALADARSPVSLDQTVGGIDLVTVPGGCFRMGDDIASGDQDELPVHEVCLDGFRIGKYEISQGQWQDIMGGNPSSHNGENFPVEQVSWSDVQGYISKLNIRTGRNFRLPTEAEWEYACRSGGRQEKYCGGNDIGSFGWYAANSGGESQPVGTGCSNGLGIYDMSGNVNEWVADWYEGYTNQHLLNPMGPAIGSGRIVRGGSWFLNVWRLRSTHRTGRRIDTRDDDLGFRIVLPNEEKGNSIE